MKSSIIKKLNIENASISFKNMNLMPKLIIAYLSSILVPLLLFGSILYLISIREIEVEMRNLSFQSVRQVSKIFDEYISQIDTISLMPYIDKSLEQYLLSTSGINTQIYAEKYPNQGIDKVQNFLENLMKVKNDIDFVSVISLNGNITSNSRYGIVKPQFDFFNDQLYKELRESTGEKTVLPVHKSSFWFAPRKNIFSIGRRILDFTEGFYIGYILIDCNEAVFERICGGINIGKSGYILIADKNGDLLYSSKKGYDGSETREILRKTVGKKKVNSVEDIGVNKLILVSDASEYSGSTVVGVIPYEEILQRVKGIKIIFMSLYIICIILVFVFSILISKGVTKPIRNLQNVMKTVEKGNTDIRVSIHSYNEIGELSHSFNQLMEKINFLLTSIKSIEIKKREAELDALKSQINPHFLYNTLESIRMMAVIDDNCAIARAIESLANLLRYNIRERKDIVDVKDEIEQVKNYIYLLKMRYEDKFEVVYDIDEHLLQFKTIKFTLQPIIENAIHHGIEKKGGKGLLRLSVKKTMDNLIFEVQDNGMGIEKRKLDELKDYIKSYGGDGMKSIGLKNVNERAMLYFGERYGLSIESNLAEGTCVRLTIPAFNKEEWVIENVINISGR